MSSEDRVTLSGDTYRLDRDAGGELGTIHDTEHFIRRELEPFAEQLAGGGECPVSLSLHFYQRLKPDEEMSVHMGIEQMARGLGGLCYKLSVTHYQELPKQALKENWPQLSKVVNEQRTKERATKLIKTDTRPADFDSIATFVASVYQFQRHKRPHKNTDYGYELVRRGNTYMVDIHSTEDTGYDYDESAEDCDLQMVNTQLNRVLTKEDIDEVYFALSKLGHRPADKRRARKALGRTAVPKF